MKRKAMAKGRVKGTASWDKVVKSTGVSRAVLIAYCESGILEWDPDELPRQALNDEFVRAVRRIEFLREHHGINLHGIRIITELLREVERLREELRFQRES